jgi:fatty acid desaturase
MVNNRFFYNAFALMLLSDPQLYLIIHGWHHSQVHTYQDPEFHPLGEIKSRWFRIVYNWLEVLIGTAFLFVVANIIIPRDKRFAGKYQFWKLLLSLVAMVILIGGIACLSHIIFKVPMSQVLLMYALTYWFGSFFLHQSQLVEHGNLIINGTFNQRNIRTRNLLPKGIIEKLFLFFTHNDSREHVLHHTMPDKHSRPFPGEFPLPESAMLITMRVYLRILGRMLVGKVDEESSRDLII